MRTTGLFFGSVNVITRFALLVCLLPAIAIALAEPPPTSDQTATSQQQLRDDIQFLASEDLRGRGVDDPESIAKAAQYIADRMQMIGLNTELYDGKPFQPVPLTLDPIVGAEERNRIEFLLQGNSEPLIATAADGMSPLSIGSLSGRVVGPLAFVGYGITATEHSYDDYAGMDVGGAVVVMLRKEPGASDPDSPFSGTSNTRHAFFSTKIENAIKHGASAVILVNDRASIQHNRTQISDRIDRERQSRDQTQQQLHELPPEASNTRETLTTKLESIDAMILSLQEELQQSEHGILDISEAGHRPDGKASIPVASVSRNLIDQVLVRATGRGLAPIEAKIDQTHSPQSFSLPSIPVDLRIEMQPTMADTSNVIGVIPGRGPLSQQSLVVGAHYDHVGMGRFGSLAPGTIAIHNGADDNASGVAALLATAQEIQQRVMNLDSHRRVIFIAFTGEERGLIGSKRYVRAPRFPLESTIAMINMDMVGRLTDNELTVYGTGSAPMLTEILDQANQRHQFNLFRVATGYGPSDHQSFYEAGIPVIFFFTGLHNDYHRPSDDFQKINFGGLSRITDTISDVTFQLATREDRPQYVKTESLARIRRQLTAFLGVTVSDQDGHVVLTGLTTDGPAQISGLLVGDSIVKLDGFPIKKSSDVLELVREHSPDDKIIVRVIRQGNAIDLKVQLASRPTE